MAIDPDTEDLVRFEEARDCFPGHRRVSLATLHRWRQRGVCGGVKLETIRSGAARFTSRQAIARFVERLNATDSVATAPTPSALQRRNDAAREALRAAGV